MGTMRIDETNCARCGICAKVCPVSAISFTAGSVPSMDNVKKLFCINCGQCEAFCPKHALDLSFPGCDAAHLPFDGSSVPPDALGRYLMNRRSVRQFRPQEVERTVIESALEIARYAPSGKNCQPVHWVILHSRAKRDAALECVIEWTRDILAQNSPMKKRFPASAVLKLHEAGEDMVFRGAPHAAIACVKTDTVMGEEAYTDGIIAMSHFDIALPSFGLGGFWCGFFTMPLMHSEKLRTIVGIPEGYRVCYAYAFGRPVCKAASFPKRKTLEAGWV